jgi:ADP-L-glycero-D-manno-heptose 6-epimerase
MIVVTGGAGFIGSNLIAALAERGEKRIVACDVLDHPAKKANLEKHAVAALVAPGDLMAWLEQHGAAVDTVFHMGATSATTVTDMEHLLDNNVGMSLDLWRWCSRNRRRLIYASSAATYGDGREGFDDDNAPAALARLKPLNRYGLSKQIFDMTAIMLAHGGFKPAQWAGLKFFNVYGPNEQHKGGQRSVAVQLYEQIGAAGGVRLFRSHNPDFDDGGQLRDFIWVGDCVDVMLWLYDNPVVTGIFNCGTGEARSFLDLAKACFAAMGRAPRIEFVDTPEAIRANYQYFTEARMDRLRDAGYGRAFMPLETGVALYIQKYLATNDPRR